MTPELKDIKNIMVSADRESIAKIAEYLNEKPKAKLVQMLLVSLLPQN
jgi:hypothetical protein